MKTLKTIQTLCKAGKIISKVLFILCIVGAALCAAGIISLAVIPEGIKIDGLTIRGLVQKNAGVSLGTCYAAMAAAIVLCAGEAVLCKFAELYFKRELAAGTPFTFDGAKELVRLGILTLAVPAVAGLAAAMVFAVMKAVFADVTDIRYDHYLSIGMGLAFIFAGLLCRHGAEISAESSAPSAEEKPAE